MQDYNTAKFSIVNISNGKDLVFGQNKIFDKDSIKFFSFVANDTIFHLYSSNPNNHPNQDSVLFVTFDFTKNETVYVKLNNTDIDTLTLAYKIIDDSPCCQEYTNVLPLLYNTKPLAQQSGGLTIIKK